MTTLIAAARRADIWARTGDWLMRHQSVIRRAQWTTVGVYAVLLIVPVILPLPDNTSFIWNNFTRFAQFAFWGVWWPFVLVSTMLVGRVWCGILCPEGTISEFASRHGRGRAIPRWMLWAGWPTVAFAATTVYGQMVSVYQYPMPVLLILGGSTLGAAAVGYLYGKNKRIWCRYLCPVTGVFGLLAKLAPLHFRTDQEAWRLSQRSNQRPAPVNCAPLLPLKTMTSASACHMCGRCSGFRGAITLARRSPNHEIVHVAGRHPNPWETVLVVFGLMGVAAGAFHWSASPWFIAAKQAIAVHLIDHGLLWPLEASAPWWILTNYPQASDALSLLDGGLLLAYVTVTALALGIFITLCLGAATLCMGSWLPIRFHHLAQSLIPVAAAGVFLGLSALTVSQLRMDGIVLPLVTETRIAVLAAASLWSGYLGWRISGLYTEAAGRRIAAMVLLAAALTASSGGWVMYFLVW